jgi:hypothetical protein
LLAAGDTIPLHKAARLAKQTGKPAAIGPVFALRKVPGPLRPRQEKPCHF